MADIDITLDKFLELLCKDNIEDINTTAISQLMLLGDNKEINKINEILDKSKTQDIEQLQDLQDGTCVYSAFNFLKKIGECKDCSEGAKCQYCNKYDNTNFTKIINKYKYDEKLIKDTDTDIELKNLEDKLDKQKKIYNEFDNSVILFDDKILDNNDAINELKKKLKEKFKIQLSKYEFLFRK